MRDQTIETSIETGTGSAMNVRIHADHARRGGTLVLVLHGGAFSGGCLDDGDWVATLLAQAGAVVVSADYPTTHPFPAAVEATFGLLQTLHTTRGRWAEKTARLFVAGEEAGGNLAAVLAMMARDRCGPKLAGQILMSPMLDASMATCSIRDADAGAARCRWAIGWRRYLGSPEKAAHPYAAPASATRLGGLPPALVLTSEADPMRDESLTYAQRLRDSGVAVRSCTFAGPARRPNALGDPAEGGAGWEIEMRDALSEFLAATP